MKIIISETQNKFLIESKNLGATQTLVDMVIDDYISGCDGATVFSNLTFAMCQGLKKGSIEVKVIDVDPFYGKNENKKVLFFRVKLSLIVDQKWLVDDDYEIFEKRLSIRADNIIGSLKYFFTVDEIILKEDNEMVNENNMMDLRLKRRGVDLEEIEEMIMFQTEIQDPENFDDGDEYADFCITQAISFYYCDEGYCDDYDEEEDNENHKLPSKEMHEIRDQVENYMVEKLYDTLVSLWEEWDA